MKVLVTGGTGLIGSSLVEALVRKGYHVRSLQQGATNSSKFAGEHVENIKGDIRDFELVQRAVNGCHKVYHLAGKVSKPGTPAGDYFSVNVEGTRNVAQACLNAEVERLVHGSSTGVYGTIKNPPVDEKTPCYPNSPYRKSKWMAEKVVLSHYQKDGLPVVLARLTTVLGAGAHELTDLIAAISAGNFRPLRTGDNYYHTIDVRDAVQGLVGCCETPEIAGNCYILAGGKPLQTKQMLNLLAEELEVGSLAEGVSPLPFKVFSQVAQLMYRFFEIQIPLANRYDLFLTNKKLDISRAQKELGFSPEVDPEISIHRMIEWYRQKDNNSLKIKI